MKRILLTREMALLTGLVLLLVGFSIYTPGFFDLFNLLDRSRYWVITGLIAVPMTFVIATSGIDLSVGSIVALSSMVLGLSFHNLGWPIGVASFAAIATGLLAGGLNGVIISKLRIPPLVVTLATMAFYSGLAYGISKAKPITGFPPSFQWISQGDAFEFNIGGGPVFFPVSLLFLIAIYIGGTLLLRKSWFGRYTEAIGENETAAEFAAINVRKMKLAIYTFSGLIAGIAALFYSAQFASARPDAGKGLELEAVACVVVGGTRISGGRGSIPGTLLGLLIIGILRYGLEMSGVKSEHLIIVIGVLLIIMAVFNEWMATRSGGRQ